MELQDALVTRTYRPLRNRRVEIPKDGGKKVRVLGIPAIRDRVVQGALKLILEPIFEADFHDGERGQQHPWRRQFRHGLGETEVEERREHQQLRSRQQVRVHWNRAGQRGFEIDQPAGLVDQAALGVRHGR